jgi:hypothetical protein
VRRRTYTRRSDATASVMLSGLDIIKPGRDTAFRMSILEERRKPHSATRPVDQARRDRRDFGSPAVAYIVINAFLIGVWAVTGAGSIGQRGCWPAGALAWYSTPGMPSCVGRSPTLTSTTSCDATAADHPDVVRLGSH